MKTGLSLPSKRRLLVLSPNLQGNTLTVGFFDADSTLRKTRSGRPSPHGRHDVLLIKDTFSHLKRLSQQGVLLAIVSNQAGIEKGYIDYSEVEEGFQATIKQFYEEGIFFNYYDFAESRDDNRKPGIEMAWRLERKLKLAGKNIVWNKSFMVGDAGWRRGHDIRPDGFPGTDHSSSDRLFAEGIARRHPEFIFFHAKDFFKI